MQTEIEILKEQMVEALKMIRRLTDIVAVYGPEYAHGEPTAHVVEMARLLLGDTTPLDRKIVSLSAAELVDQPSGKYD